MGRYIRDYRDCHLWPVGKYGSANAHPVWLYLDHNGCGPAASHEQQSASNAPGLHFFPSVVGPREAPILETG
jgi:hypothetical protein